MEKSVAIFDVDGTLFDTKKGIIGALNYVVQEAGLSAIKIEQEDDFVGPPIKDTLIKCYGIPDNAAMQLTQRYREVYVSKYIENTKAYENALEVLAELKKRGIVLGIATLKTKMQVERLIEIYEIGHYFNIVMTASENGNVSKIDMLQSIRKLYANEERQFYMIGDTLGDYNAAINNEYSFIAADYGYGDISNIQCKHIGHIEQVTSIIV